ncbi:unnamed protein product [Medioppia subpectinata]|uniref:Cytochrome P450 n=1 Tax=Medioppia subpectinata TaxID=1979941 RepID=A0A7R9KHQ8_9ACAR|nr:unnamed protein product [Medioppia subpectinata]CAG2102769.1 unnamed protein product [Medioppia subpectinata]
MILASLFGLNSLIVLVTSLVILYFYLTRNFKYWSSRGIDGPKPIVGFGTLYQIFFKPLTDVNTENFKKYGKIYGTFLGTKPVLMIADPELTKEMNIKDFHLFVNRNDFVTGDSLNDRSMFNLMDDEWKNMRSIISPTFSSGKMKAMHPIIVDCTQRLEEYLEKKAVTGEEVEMKKIMGNLTMDVIASCAFGTKIDTHNDEKRSDFILNAQKVFRGNWRVWAFFLFMTTFPKLVRWTGFTFNDPTVVKFFRTAITSIIRRRKSESESGGKKRDYLQLMINAQNKSEDKAADEQEIDDLNEEIFGKTDPTEALKFNKMQTEISEDDILATSFIFFVAGYETTATLLSLLFYSLAVDPKCQQKLYEEVKRFDGNFSYENISKMPYLEACVAETLRLYNPISAVGRMASEEYKIGDTGLTIPKGMLVNFDVQTLHHNPDYYPDPDRWDPERFMPENRDQLVPYTYMPFGMGPRNCVGMRFALMEAKTAAAHLVNKFIFKKTAKTTVPPKLKKFEFLLTTEPLITAIEKRH